VEFADVEGDVPVVSIGDGVVELSKVAEGYGGVAAIRYTIEGRSYLAIYGHLRPSALMPKGAGVLRGQQIGVLGRGNTQETDGERKHLHFGIYTGSDANIRGYVDTAEEFLSWIDPQGFLMVK
jgi:murein DD-endopeptidase MepM/ murein hydrolase activator NlpD